MSKGSNQRPRNISKEAFDKNWEAIFGKKNKPSHDAIEVFQTASKPKNEKK